jgi:hypothetical protein
MIVLVIGLVYQIVQSGLNQKVLFDPIILIALIAAVLAKGISNFYLDRKD